MGLLAFQVLMNYHFLFVKNALAFGIWLMLNLCKMIWCPRNALLLSMWILWSLWCPLGWATAFLANIRLWQDCILMTNPLAYYKNMFKLLLFNTSEHSWSFFTSIWQHQLLSSSTQAGSCLAQNVKNGWKSNACISKALAYKCKTEIMTKKRFNWSGIVKKLFAGQSYKQRDFLYLNCCRGRN
jgi:hypothetical protein